MLMFRLFCSFPLSCNNQRCPQGKNGRLSKGGSAVPNRVKDDIEKGADILEEKCWHT